MENVLFRVIIWSFHCVILRSKPVNFLSYAFKSTKNFEVHAKLLINTYLAVDPIQLGLHFFVFDLHVNIFLAVKQIVIR